MIIFGGNLFIKIKKIMFVLWKKINIIKLCNRIWKGKIYVNIIMVV